MKKLEKKSLHFADDKANEEKEDRLKESFSNTALEDKIEKKSILKKSSLESPVKNQTRDNLENNSNENDSGSSQIPKLNLKFDNSNVPQSEPSKEITKEGKFLKNEIKNFDDSLIKLLNDFKFQKEEESQPNFQKNKERNFKIRAEKNVDIIEDVFKSGALRQALVEIYKRKF